MAVIQQGNTSKPPGKPFTKGDPRINRKGRPKNFDALRTLAQTISHEEQQAAGQPVVVNGHIMTVIETLLRSWAESDNPILQKAFVEIAFGKVPNKLDLSGDEDIKITVTYDKSREDKE